MARPCKFRRVSHVPGVTYFKPAGIPLKFLKEIHLSIEEAEALRLKDLEGLEQEQAAEKMNISRPTFQRILSVARRKIADAILNGKSVRIGGGNFQISPRRFMCSHGHEWIVEMQICDVPDNCPTCRTTDIRSIEYEEIAGKKV